MRVVIDVVTVSLLISLILVTYRLFRGPTIADRAIAADLIALHVVALIAVYSLATNQSILIDLVIITAVVGFTSTSVIGIYLDRAARGKARAEGSDN